VESIATSAAARRREAIYSSVARVDGHRKKRIL
jgi:hypothetical protein